MFSLNGLLSKEITQAASLAAFPAAGAAARLYIADDTGNVYRWNGTTLAYALIGGSGSGSGVSDHGALTGLADDDHPQYLTEARADVRYAIQGSGGSGVTDHGVLTGLGDDDHPHYYNQVRGDARYSLTTHGHAVATGSVDGFFSAANFTKLAGIATGATANATDAQLRDRTTHTGVQTIATITGLQAALDGKRATGAIGINELSSGGASNGQVLKFDAGLGQWLPGTDNVGSGGGGGAVDSVFGRIGAVVAASGDYTFAQIGSKPTTLAGYSISDAAPLSHVGAGTTAHAAATSLAAGFMTAAQVTKLDGIPANATANSSDATLLARANHTGSQAISTVSGLQAALDAKHVAIQFQDEGSNLGTAATADTINFTGLGVSVSRASNVVTVNVPITNDPTKAPLTPVAENITTGSAYTLVVADEGKVKRLVDGAAQTVHLTTAMNGKAFTLRKIASAGAVTIDVNAGCNVNGLGDAVNLAFAAAGGAIYFQPTGTNTWDALGSVGDFTVADITDMSANARTFNQAANFAAMVDALGGAASSGTGGLARLTSPTFVTPALGTPSALVLTNATGLPVAGGGTGRATGTTAYALIATGTTATGAQQSLAAGATTELLVGGGASALPVWTTATGSGAPVRATSPTLVTPLLGTPTSGNLSNCTADGTDLVGFRGVPINSQSTAYTAVLADAGKCLYHPSADTTARTFTIPANGSVAYPVGTILMFENDISAGTMTIAITTDTLVLVGAAGSTGSRMLAAGGRATAVKVTSTRWRISGTAELT